MNYFVLLLPSCPYRIYRGHSPAAVAYWCDAREWAEQRFNMSYAKDMTQIPDTYLVLRGVDL